MTTTTKKAAVKKTPVKKAAVKKAAPAKRPAKKASPVNGVVPPDAVAPVMYFMEVPLADIHPAPDNPRTNLGDLTGLAESITAVGILEPILVQTRAAGGYMIVAGHRRYEAAKLTTLVSMPCLLRVFTEQARIEAMVIENLQRQDLSPFDEARGLTQLVGVGLTQRDIAERVGVSQSHISKRLSLATMPPQVEVLFDGERLTIRQLEEIAKVPEDALRTVVDRLVKRAAQMKDTLLPDWAIKAEIDDLKRIRKHNEAEKAGEASNLKRIVAHPYIGAGDHRPCVKKDATHWYLGDRDQTITWARTAAAHNAANPPSQTPTRPASPHQLQNEAAERIRAFAYTTIVTAVAGDPFAVREFVDVVTRLVRDRLTTDWLEINPLDDSAVEAVIADDAGLYVACAQLLALASWEWDLPVLELFVAAGYRTTGAGESFPDGFDTSTVLTTADDEFFDIEAGDRAEG